MSENLRLILTTVGLAGVVVLMYWAAAIARRKLGIGAGTLAPGAIKVVGKRPLEPGKALYVVKLADRYVLVGTSEGSVSLVDRITAEEFATMAEPEEDQAKALAPAPAPAPASAADDAAAGAAAHAPREDSPVPADRFMTVGESFGYFLGKARRARGSEAAAEATHDAAGTEVALTH